MKLENDIGVWEPNELVYAASDLPTYSYLVMDGQAQIVSPSGLRLSSIGYNELFGEASFILGKNRTVTAIAGEDGLTARLIKSDHLISKLRQDIFIENNCMKTSQTKYLGLYIDSKLNEKWSINCQNYAE